MIFIELISFFPVSGEFFLENIEIFTDANFGELYFKANVIGNN